MTVGKGIGWRSVLFVPGSRPDRFDKAITSDADAVCVDLEDAVAPAHKDQARAAATAFLAHGGGGGSPDRVLRINSPRKAVGLRDLLAVIEARPSGGTLLIPKVESAEELCWIDQLLTEAALDLTLVALLETPRAIDRAPAIVTAGPTRRLTAVMLGGLDLSAELGASGTWESLLFARSRLVQAAAQAGIAAIDMPFVDVGDPEGCGSEARRALALGFTAKMAIHPTQVPIINETYTPTPEEVARAQRVVRALADAPDGVLLLDGKMVERPVVLAMERVLARARAAGLPPRRESS
ncbi:MAG TPA: CoA ester lyase [Hyphomicrobiaceae bacterium]